MSDQARSTVGQRQIGRAGQKRANLDLDRPGKQVPRAGTNDIGQWIINRGRLTESKNIGSLGHGVSLSSRGSGRLVTRLDTPPSSHRHHPDSAIARRGSLDDVARYHEGGVPDSVTEVLIAGMDSHPRDQRSAGRSVGQAHPISIDMSAFRPSGANFIST
ncbi:hypothetical protein ACVMHY_001405 [Bradyrhizobium barranii subsp. barranii]